jgi:Starch synthase catalytic domain
MKRELLKWMPHHMTSGHHTQAHYRDHGKMTYARSVLTLHNMAYQGRGPFAELEHFEIPDSYRDAFFLDDPVGGEHMNIMKAGIITASRIVAVSAGCAPARQPCRCQRRTATRGNVDVIGLESARSACRGANATVLAAFSQRTCA